MTPPVYHRVRFFSTKKTKNTLKTTSIRSKNWVILVSVARHGRNRRAVRSCANCLSHEDKKIFPLLDAFECRFHDTRPRKRFGTSKLESK